MSRTLARLSLAISQSRAQLVLQLPKVSQFSMNLAYFFLQSATHRRAWPQPASSQLQEFADFIERESQSVYSLNEPKCFDIALTVFAVATWSSGRAWQQAGALVEPNRIDTEADLLGHGSDLHRLGSSRKSYTLEYSPESTSFWRWIRAADDGRRLNCAHMSEETKKWRARRDSNTRPSA
jgi:hypothetical protein